MFVTFAIKSLVDNSAPLTLAQAFAASSAIALIVGRTSEIVGIFPNFGASLRCFTTIQEYLNKQDPQSFYTFLISQRFVVASSVVFLEVIVHEASIWGMATVKTSGIGGYDAFLGH